VLRNVVAVANGKGGCGKTTLAVNLAGYAALGGWKVLVVELDPQGNAGLDLGMGAEWAADGGRRLYDALMRGEPLEPLRDARPGLDVLPAGRETAAAETALRNDERLLGERLAGIAGDYNLVIVDCPPATTSPAVRAALAAARWLIIPTVRDRGSIEGLGAMAEEVARARATSNPGLDLLGVALIAFETRSVVLREVRAEVTAALAGTGAVVFDQVIRAAAHAAEHARSTGRLMYEYEEAAMAAEPFWRRRRDGGDVVARERSWSKAAPGLAEDYQGLSREILRAFAAGEGSTGG
jgi:cellulose biosynthesis protein BcsQ